MLLLVAATLGCASASASRRSAALATVCYPQQCFLDIQNDNGMSIGVRYYDSSGVGDVLGLVKQGVRRFTLSRRTSRTVIVEVTLDRQVYRSQARLSLPPAENVFHFPSDFAATR
jgi:hypothetical protein